MRVPRRGYRGQETKDTRRGETSERVGQVPVVTATSQCCGSGAGRPWAFVVVSSYGKYAGYDEE
jgi:hypothetical protein